MNCGRVILLVLTAIIVQAPLAHAGPIIIDIVSESYRLSGCHLSYGCYDISSTESIYEPHGAAWAITSVSDSQVLVETRASAALWWGKSLAEVVFRPRTSGFAEALVSGRQATGDWYVRLQDITTGDWLFDEDCGIVPTCSESFSLWFVDGHEYKLGVFVYQSDIEPVEARVTMPFTTAPEPGSTLLLFGIGIVGLRAWRKRFQ